ncbi:MAG TPA: hypothetical protein P5064_04015 [Clostridia bacterium]|jgi:hypothetical protein|nr:hypothetical protein [Clostridiaceae bacterium]HOF26380.1 hypothetical protein [Clostridia bacterium]HOM34213.1 hypothetical protein [Clostridia bacterium]HOR89739.1 hypothetical protein [Clostridia bacterium]HOT71377.1 hypothetical protein [Clostridia bacterium]
MVKNKIRILLFILVFLILTGCNRGTELNPKEKISETPAITDNTDIQDEPSIKYKTADIESLIDILNEQYEKILVQPFKCCTSSSEPIAPVSSMYDGSGNIYGRILSKIRFIQGLVAARGNIISINIIEDMTFDNGGYVFGNSRSYNNFFERYTCKGYTMSIYKYKNCYVVFEFFNFCLPLIDKVDFMEEFAAVLEENYADKDKPMFIDEEGFYIPKEHKPEFLDKFKNEFNVLYKENITSKFQEYTQSAIPLFEIDKESSSTLAEVTYNQSIIQDNSVIVTLVEDNTSDNGGFVYTTDLTDNASLVAVYRYDKLYVIFELHGESFSEIGEQTDETVVRSVAKILSDLEK